MCDTIGTSNSKFYAYLVFVSKSRRGDIDVRWTIVYRNYVRESTRSDRRNVSKHFTIVVDCYEYQLIKIGNL